MKALHAIAAVAILAVIAVVGAVGADAPGRPTGVNAADWAPISDTLGVVMDQALPPAGSAGSPASPADQAGQRISRGGAGFGGAALIPPISGYLMVKRGNLWQRLILVDPVKGPGVAG